jgi:selenocysteine lyase/cysteine desulfurase
MIYLDYGATSFRKPRQVAEAVQRALARCANPGRGGYGAAREAAEVVYGCRERAGRLFGCGPERVVFTSNCTHGLNIAIRSLVKPGNRVVVSGFEHNAVTRPLHALGVELRVAGRKLFDWEDTLNRFEDGLKGADAAVFTHVSNVFGYILPVEAMAALCRDRRIPFILDAAQSAGSIPLSLEKLGADFIAMPGHKGLLGPQGTGLLLCGREGEPLLRGGTGSDSIRQDMPDYLPERLEAGTMNVPGIAGLSAGLAYLEKAGVERIGQREARQARRCAEGLKKMGYRVFSGAHQGGTVSFLPEDDCEEAAEKLARRGIAVRAGLHCAPLAHESAGTLETGTVSISFGWDAADYQTGALMETFAKGKERKS